MSPACSSAPLSPAPASTQTSLISSSPEVLEDGAQIAVLARCRRRARRALRPRAARARPGSSSARVVSTSTSPGSESVFARGGVFSRASMTTRSGCLMPSDAAMPASSRRASSDGSSSTIVPLPVSTALERARQRCTSRARGGARDPLARRRSRARCGRRGSRRACCAHTAPAPHAREEAAIQRLGRALHDAAFDGDAGSRELLGAAAVDARVRIVRRKHHARDFSFDQRFRARARSARVAARLERHVGRRAARGGARRRSATRSACGPPAGAVQPVADDAPSLTSTQPTADSAPCRRARSPRVAAHGPCARDRSRRPCGQSALLLAFSSAGSSDICSRLSSRLGSDCRRSISC